MTEKTLVYLANGKVLGKKIVVFDNVEHIRVLSNPLAWQIMGLLSDTPMYPIEIAKKLKIYEQSAYYYNESWSKLGLWRRPVQAMSGAAQLGFIILLARRLELK